MEISPAGMGTTGPDRAAANPAGPPLSSSPRAGGALTSGDTVATLIGELSQSEGAHLLQILDSIPRIPDDAQAAQLLAEAAEDITRHGGGHALHAIRQMAGRDPVRAEALAEAPELSSIRHDVEKLLAELTAARRMHAEDSLARAGERWDAGTLKTAEGEGRPDVFLMVAGKLIEAGGLANYTRSAAVSAALIDPTLWVPAASPAARQAEERASAARMPVSLWIAVGIGSIAACWWLRQDYLPVVSAAWGGVAILAILRRRHLR